MELSNEFSVDEYDNNEFSNHDVQAKIVNEAIDYQVKTNVSKVDDDTNICKEDIKTASPIQFRRVPRRIR